MIEYNDRNTGVVMADGSLKNPAVDILGNSYRMDRVSMQYVDATHFVMLPTGFRGVLPPFAMPESPPVEEVAKRKKPDVSTIDNAL